MFSPLRLVAAALLIGLGATACSAARSGAPPTPGIVRVVAAENFWGNIASQLGGSHAQVTSIISDPTTDPHLYESNARDASAVADAQLVIETGLGYDDFVDKLVSASSNRHRTVLTVAKVLDVSGSGANPHLWYDIPRMPQVASAIVAQLIAADPRDTATFTRNLATFDASLAPARAVIDEIKAKHPGAPVADTERVPGYLLAAASLDVKTPDGFARAIEDGNEPSPADTQAMEQLFSDPLGVRVLLYNEQATSPATQHIRDLAASKHVPIVTVTETMPRDQPTYQAWQLHQARQLLAALGG